MLHLETVYHLRISFRIFDDRKFGDEIVFHDNIHVEHFKVGFPPMCLMKNFVKNR